MDLSQIKMVVTDMDGTLLNSNHEVSPRFFEIFEELKKKDIIFVAASGRQYNSMVDKLEAIKNDIIVIAENGALIKKQEDVLLTTPITQQEVGRILDVVKPLKDVHPVLCGQYNAYANDSSDAFLTMLREYYSEFDIVKDQMSVETEVLKIAIYHFEDSEKFIYPSVQHLEDNLKVKVSGANWVDVSHKNAHKGYALQKVMDQYKIAANEVMVFGDYNNDLEMMELSNYSFAMANAHPNVKKVAKYETVSNNDFGVERVLEKLL
ncbi:HAD family hydrolase [Flagellimonas iocasae]|uniref:HAD family hydrolase n=1 Tax=Flagellimonas iocasae TaxID=2055905 RepID=A0ABW4Y215_9FLAO